MSMPNVLNNNDDTTNRQQKISKQDWRYYRYKPSSDRIKHLLNTQMDNPRKQKESEPRTIFEPAKFSLPSRYEVVQILGKGSYGTVCSVNDKINPDNVYPIAVKKITNIFYREILLKRAIRELKFMTFFKGHKNIVSLIDCEIVSEKPYDGLYCYQELIDYDLAKVIHSSVQLSNFHIKHLFYQILCGLKYIHSAEVIHRDLKPGNILCTLNGCLKICDFGLARGLAPQFFTSKDNYHDITNYVATRWYRAPELILSENTYGKSIDMWSIGCILGEFYGRKPLFMGKDSIHQIHEIMKVLGPPSKEVLLDYGSLKAWNSCHSASGSISAMADWTELYPSATLEALDLIEGLLKWDPKKRLTIEQALEHPFLTSVRNLDDEPVCPWGAFDFSYEYQLYSMPRLREFLINEVAMFRGDRVKCNASKPHFPQNIKIVEEARR
ncbi:hypothetical protein HG536_0B02410 [Torulaspora globosa]|uniref:Protein kinase domain-containing protein n=1 Tax=Torulaspora globosa TaxID=48254 RepID=A0A7G3ZCZ2_9SACH|nr:uncharacterized protein HG536_0B02410 [Torulaspora globosa]QLL31378.1 hypothetical protein HG536_0B02410 [Torulaspora globosa]